MDPNQNSIQQPQQPAPSPVRTGEPSSKNFNILIISTLAVVIIGLVAGILFLDKIKQIFIPSKNTVVRDGVVTAKKAPDFFSDLKTRCTLFNNLRNALSSPDFVCALDFSRSDLTAEQIASLSSSIARLPKLEKIIIKSGNLNQAEISNLENKKPGLKIEEVKD